MSNSRLISNQPKVSFEELRQRAKSALHRGDVAETERFLAKVLKHNKKDHVSYAIIGELHLSQNRIQEAMLAYTQAVNLHPQSLAYKERFVEIAGRTLAAGYSKALADALVSCLRTPEVDCTKITRFWLSLLKVAPRFDAIYGLATRKSFDPSSKSFFEQLADFRPLFTPLFLEGIRNLLIYDPLFEEFITHVRQHLLNDLGSARSKFTHRDHLTLAAALSHYAFFSDFLLGITAEEERKIEALRNRIEGEKDSANDAPSVAVLACYRPLYGLANATEILENFTKVHPLSDVVQAQIADYFSLRDAAAAVVPITAIDRGVSTSVREQYESFPYPSWKAISKAPLVRSWGALECNRNTEWTLQGRKAQILVAGCGTGREAAVLATVFPDAAITAVDLSRTSLAYAASQARKHNLTNITFRHGDILGLPVLENKFDYVSASGVLHHMENPVEGWKVCSGLLKPDGLMRIGLYSEIGRRAVVAARDAIEKGNYPPDETGMRDFRRDGPNIMDSETLLELTNFQDYYHLNMYRDLLFHVQEHRFNIPQISTILAELRLTFEGFYLPPSVFEHYGQIFPDDPRKTDLGNWHQLEQQNPLTFMHMYVFWCRKSQ